MSRNNFRFSFALVAVMPWAGVAQTNAPLMDRSPSAGSASIVQTVPVRLDSQASAPMAQSTATLAPVESPSALAVSPGVSEAVTASAETLLHTDASTYAEASVYADAPAPQDATYEAPVAPTTAVVRERMGDVTRSLLALQADGQSAGGELPILGPVSTASWNRYLKSFNQAIPQWFTEKVESGRN